MAHIFWACSGRGNPIKRFTRFLLGWVTQEVYITNSVSQLSGVKNQVFYFSFSQKLTHELDRRLPRFDSFILSRDRDRDREPISVVVLLLRGYLAAANWKNSNQSRYTCWFSVFVIISCVFLSFYLRFSF